MDDRATAKGVQFILGAEGKVWLNVDGVCVFRCQKSDRVDIEYDGRTKKSYNGPNPTGAEGNKGIVSEHYPNGLSDNFDVMG